MERRLAEVLGYRSWSYESDPDVLAGPRAQAAAAPVPG
jgi:hypothetical protein